MSAYVHESDRPDEFTHDPPIGESGVGAAAEFKV